MLADGIYLINLCQPKENVNHFTRILLNVLTMLDN